MNGSLSSNQQRLEDCLALQKQSDLVELVVAPVSLHLQAVSQQLSGRAISVAAQTVSEFGDGAYTGEWSASMLAELDCRYVIVGHSERRSLYHETDLQVAAKVAAVQQAGLCPILCVGETLAQREAHETLTVITGQMEAVLLEVGAESFAKQVIAYEPVWAIGTGLAATDEQAQEVHRAIRGWIEEKCGENASQSTQILYGGSVKPDNARLLFSQPDIDGGLIGGASLQAEDFMAIAQAAQAVMAEQNNG